MRQGPVLKIFFSLGRLHDLRDVPCDTLDMLIHLYLYGKERIKKRQQRDR